MVNLNTLLSDASRTIVGKLCKQAEILEASSNNEETKEKLRLLKAFNKELIYEEFRTINNNLRTVSGLKEFNLYKAPTKS